MNKLATKTSFRPIILLSVLSLQMAILGGTLLHTWDTTAADLFMRWRLKLNRSDRDRKAGQVAMVAIDKKTLDAYGLYGRGQWLTRKPFVEQLSYFSGRYSPSVVAYDLLFQETLGDDHRGADNNIGMSLSKLTDIRETLDDLIHQGDDFAPNALMNIV